MTKALPSWESTPTRENILDFVASVTDRSSHQYVPRHKRVAVFDNDGTLWCEKPLYIQFDYLLRKMAEQARQEPGLRSQQPWKAAWEKDFDWLGDAITRHYQGDDSGLQLIIKGILHLAEGMEVEQLEAEARQFIQDTEHPTLGFRYKDCIYRPMLELIEYLEVNGFTNYIVSGGGRDFMRGFSEGLYGIPRERVIGSTLAYNYVAGEAGEDSILAAGNSNGDLQMLNFAGGKSLPALRLLVVHDDAEREFDYQAGAEKVIEVVDANSWTSISINEDWKKVFPV
jgi:phosphoglycolate phosphatase-like HAD superfamily hydrolase